MSDLLSAASLLLAVVSVVYGLWYPEIVHAMDTTIPKHAEDRRRPYKDVSTMLFRRSLPLAIAALVVTAVFLPDALRIGWLSINDYSESGWSALRRYDSVATAFFVVELFATALTVHAVNLAVKLFQLRRRLAPPVPTSA